MKLLYFDDFRLGVLKGENVVDITDVVESLPSVGKEDKMRALIASFSDWQRPIQDAVAERAGIPLSGVRIRSPMPTPANIVCMAINYMENGTRSVPAPIDAFQKSRDALIGDGDTLVLGDVPATVFEGEAELALIIGKRARNVSAADAFDYIFGWTNFIDGSARGLPPGGYYQMKARATYAPIGPYIVTADEILNPQDLHVQLWNDGELMQDFNTSDMAHKIGRCIEFITASHTLEPGDIVATGTNHRGLHPFQDGNRIEIETEGLGRLHITVRDNLKRTWPKETRLQRMDRGESGTPAQLTGKYTPNQVPA